MHSLRKERFYSYVENIFFYVFHVFDWDKKFESGQETVENESHNRRSRTSVSDDNIRAIRDFIDSDRRLKIDEIALVVSISYGSVQS